MTYQDALILGAIWLIGFVILTPKWVAIWEMLVRPPSNLPSWFWGALLGALWPISALILYIR